MSPRARGALLAFAAAYVDTVGFIGLFGLFTAHVTGNFVLIGAELVNQHVDVLVKLLALPVFVLSVGLTAQAEVWMRRRERTAIGWLLGIEALLVALAALAPLWVGRPKVPDDLAAAAVGFLLIGAMGIQNALMRTSLAGPIQTTVMTGNVAQLTIDLLAIATGRADAALRSRIKASVPAVAAFAMGSAAGATGYLLSQFDCLWLAAGLIAVAALSEWWASGAKSPQP